MATLIGDGGHARDILVTTPETDWVQVKHHSEVRAFQDTLPVIIAINDPQVRARVAKELRVQDSTWVHPHAYIERSCRIGSGTHVNYGVTMTRTKIGHHCTIAPGVTICGDVVIGNRVFVGAGAVIKNLVTIGDDAFICMGAKVTRDVAPGEKYR